MTTQRTTSRKTIEKMSVNPSKQEEIDFLRAVVDSIPKNSYLSGLLDDNLMRYAERGIMNDFGISLQDMGEDNTGIEQLKEQMRIFMKDKEEQVLLLARDLEAERKKVEELKDEVDLYKGRIEEAMCDLRGRY